MKISKVRDWGRFNGLNTQAKTAEENKKIADEARNKAKKLLNKAETHRKIARNKCI